MFDTSVPGSDRGMETGKPIGDESLRVHNLPPQCSRKSATTCSVVGGMDCPLTFISHGELCARSFTVDSVSVSPDRSSIMVMDINTGPEGIFQLLIICFPGDDLSVSSAQITVEKYVARIGEEKGSDVWELDVHRSFPPARA